MWPNKVPREAALVTEPLQFSAHTVSCSGGTSVLLGTFTLHQQMNSGHGRTLVMVMAWGMQSVCGWIADMGNAPFTAARFTIAVERSALEVSGDEGK